MPDSTRPSPARLRRATLLTLGLCAALGVAQGGAAPLAEPELQEGPTAHGEQAAPEAALPSSPSPSPATPGAGLSASAPAPAATLVAAAGVAPLNDILNDAAPESAAPTCFDGQELLLQVFVANVSRGVQLAYSSPGALWLSERALLPSEAGYIVERATCEGERFVRLNPVLRVRLDEEELSLSIEPDFALLSASTVAVDAFKVRVSSDLPLWRLRYNVAGLADVAAGSAAASADLRLQYWRGPLRVEAAYTPTLSIGGGDSRQGFSIAADVQVASNASLGGFAGLSDGAPTFGVRGSVSSAPPVPLEPITVDLPVDSDVTVLVDGQPVQTFRANAGRLTVGNLYANGLTATVVVRWREGDVPRSVTRTFTLPSAVRNGAFDLAGEARYTIGSGLQGTLTGGVLLLPRVQARASVSVAEFGGTALLGVAYDDAQQNANLGATYLWTGTAARGAVQAGYARTFAEGRLGLSGTLVPTSLSESSVTLEGATAFEAVNVVGRVGYQANGTLSAGAGVSWQTGFGTGLSAAVDASAGRVRASARATFNLDENNQVAVQASTSTTGDTRAGVEYTSRFDNDRLRVRYEAPAFATATYEFRRGVEGSVTANTLGQFAGNVQGSLVWIGDRLSASGNGEGAALLLRTGQPGLTILVNGVERGTTDALGDIVLTGLAIGSGVQVGVSADYLPIEIGLREESTGFSFDREGVYDYDWSANFVRSRWVRMMWNATEPAAYAVLELPGGLRYYTDDQGAVLLPPLGAATGVLRDENGTRRCDIAVDATSGVLTCVK